MSSSNLGSLSNTEYEIVDEHGNQILIKGAEQLKEFATSVKEIKQPDGSIIKEYVLNDPKVIEQIRNRVKSNSQSANPNYENPKASVPETINLLDMYPSSTMSSVSKEVNPKPNQDLVTTYSNTNVLPTQDIVQNHNEYMRQLSNSRKFESPTNKEVNKSPSQSIGLVQQQINKLQKSLSTDISNKSNEIEQAKKTLKSDSYIKQSTFQENHQPTLKPPIPKKTQLEVKTSRGKLVQVIMMSEEGNDSDFEEVQELIKKALIDCNQPQKQEFGQSNQSANGLPLTTFNPDK